MADCPFCDRLEARDFDRELSDDGWMAVFKPLNPVTPGHLLVVPWHHCESAAADPECAKYAMAHAAALVRDHCIGPANLITSIGAAATQTVLHQHLHIVPRREGDGLYLPWSGQARIARCRYCYCALTDSPGCSAGCAHRDRGYGGCGTAALTGKAGTDGN